MPALHQTIYYTTIATIVSAITIGSGIGSARTSAATIKAIDIQPKAHADIMKASLIGLAFIESAAILSFVITILLLTSATITEYSSWALIGILCAVALPGFMVGICSSLPAQACCFSIARQPFFGQKILNIMLITQSMIQTPLLFGFLIALVLMVQLPTITTHAQSFSLFASGLALGIGCFGPALGLGRFAYAACASVSINRTAYAQLVPFTFLSQAIIETPLIFTLILSIILIGTSSNSSALLPVRAFAAALCVGIGTFGPSLGSSKTASAAVHQIATNPDQYSSLSQTSLFGQGIIDAAAVYAGIVAIFLLIIK